MLEPNNFGHLCENEYSIKEEAKKATLFTTGNGYYGVRGSFEEFGSQFVQGAFIRGLIDEVIEIPQTFIDNIYMKKYYFDEEKLKDFETQDSCINFADILYTRIKIGNKEFYPWEGKIIEWNRYLDTNNACLVREVLWDDGFGNLTRIKFERFASFSNDHIYCIKTTIKRINHKLEILISSGIDTRVKTVGQKKAVVNDYKIDNGIILLDINIGKKYGYKTAVSSHTTFYNCRNETLDYITENGIYAVKILAEDNDNEIVAEKIIYTNTSRDYSDELNVYNENYKEIKRLKNRSYEELFDNHKKMWDNFFKYMDIKIEGDEIADSILRFSNYHSAISPSRNDFVHSLSAKNLSGEKYNQFVWWDCEIYQLPIFIHTAPEVAKKVLMYRFKTLKQAKINAEKEGYLGAKYPFVSSVLGDEKVWKYARHPFMQIHINSDIAYGIINYFINTLDHEFMKQYGLEILVEISKYWLSRVELIDNKYEIRRVTGTDEHHPYINNNAYTNYLTKFVLKKTAEYLKMYRDENYEDKLNVNISQLEKVAYNLYLPCDKSGLIPQFDGYLQLNRNLEIDGNGAGKGFQMKESGLYHKSQIIKQPDVMLLYSYINLDDKLSNYSMNWDYYEKMCEKSSSLTYPVHAICSIENDRMLSFYDYFMQSIKIDIDDLHNVAYQGIHAACMAGGWYSIYRGVFGITPKINYISVRPKKVPFFKKVSIKFFYQGILIAATIDNNHFIFTKSKDDKLIELDYSGRKYQLEDKLKIELE